MTKTDYIRPLITLTVFIMGCASAVLEPQPLQPEYSKLLLLNRIPITLTVNTELPENYRSGSQFLFGILPFGSVRVPDSTKFLELALTRELAERGFQVLSAENQQTTTPVVRVSIKELSVSGFDLIFVRKPSASIRVEGSLSVNGEMKRFVEIDDSASEFTKFAFSKELGSVLEDLSSSISKKLCDQLSLHTPQL